MAPTHENEARSFHARIGVPGVLFFGVSKSRGMNLRGSCLAFLPVVCDAVRFVEGQRQILVTATNKVVKLWSVRSLAIGLQKDSRTPNVLCLRQIDFSPNVLSVTLSLIPWAFVMKKLPCKFFQSIFTADVAQQAQSAQHVEQHVTHSEVAVTFDEADEDFAEPLKSA